MVSWREALNYAGAVIGVIFFVSSFWWKFGIAVGIAVLSTMGVINMLIDDYNKDRKIKELKEEIKKYGEIIKE